MNELAGVREVGESVSFPKTEEFKDPKINVAVDRRVEAMYKEAKFERHHAAHLFQLRDTQISTEMFEAYLEFARLALQQLVIAGVHRVLGANPKGNAENVRIIERTGLHLLPSHAIAHDLTHALMARLMNGPQKGAKAFRPHFLKRPAGERWQHTLSFRVFTSGERDRNAALEENLVQLLDYSQLNRIIHEVRKEGGSLMEQHTRFHLRTLHQESYEHAQKNYSHVLDFLSRLYDQFPEDPLVVYREFLTLVRGGA